MSLTGIVGARLISTMRRNDKREPSILATIQQDGIVGQYDHILNICKDDLHIRGIPNSSIRHLTTQRNVPFVDARDGVFEDTAAVIVAPSYTLILHAGSPHNGHVVTTEISQIRLLAEARTVRDISAIEREWAGGLAWNTTWRGNGCSVRNLVFSRRCFHLS